MRSSLAIIIMTLAVCGNIAFAEAEDSAEVIVPEGSEYEIEVLVDEDIWEENDFFFTEMLLDEDSLLWFLGYVTELKADSTYARYSARMNLSGYVEKLHGAEIGHHAVATYHSQIAVDTLLRWHDWPDTLPDTTFRPIYEFDSTTVRPIFYDGPSWKYMEDVFRPLNISENGYAFLTFNRLGLEDTSYHDWNYAITKYGDIVAKIDIPYRTVRDCQIEGGYFAAFTYDTIYVFDSTGTELYRVEDFFDGHFLHSCFRGQQDRATWDARSKLLSNGSLLYFRESPTNLTIRVKSATAEYEYRIPNSSPADSHRVRFRVNKDLLFVAIYRMPQNVSDTVETKLMYCFDISDTLELLWQDTTNNVFGEVNILNSGDLIAVSSIKRPDRSWILRIFSKETGNILSYWPDTLEDSAFVLLSLSSPPYFYIETAIGTWPDLVHEKRVIKVEGGE